MVNVFLKTGLTFYSSCFGALSTVPDTCADKCMWNKQIEEFLGRKKFAAKDFLGPKEEGWKQACYFIKNTEPREFEVLPVV